MTIRFAAAHAGESTAIVRALTTVTLLPAANDNTPDAFGGYPRDDALRATLRHFAAYGLGAAQQAHRNAEAAFFAGKRHEYRHWLGICRALDKRMADAIVAHRGSGSKA
ncbi:MAG: hypothetical protein QM676_10935 [Novosphingobium sp.]